MRDPSRLLTIEAQRRKESALGHTAKLCPVQTEHKAASQPV